MTDPAERLLVRAMKLDVDERAALAAELLASLDGEPEEDVEAAWAAEIERRLASFEAGDDQGVPYVQAIDDIRRRLSGG